MATLIDAGRYRGPAASRPMPIPIVLDCDVGHDDAIAILLALSSSEVELRAVTAVAGNAACAAAPHGG